MRSTLASQEHSSSFDVSYAVFQRRKSIAVEEEQHFVGLTVALVRYERLKTEADRLWLLAAQHQVRAFKNSTQLQWPFAIR